MPTPLPSDVPLTACPGCGSVVVSGPVEEEAHCSFHLRTGDVRNGSSCPLDPWALPTVTIGAPGTEVPRGGVITWSCGHRALAL